MISSFEHRILFGICLLLLAVGSFAAFLLNFDAMRELDPNEWGDFLAGIFSPLAFALAFIAIIYQAREIRLQSREISTTNDSLEKQRFDSFFFELVATHNSIVEAISINANDNKLTRHEGRDSFRYLKDHLSRSLAERMYPDPDQKSEKTIDRYEKMYREYNSALGHYFRFVYNSLRAIDESSLSERRHKRLFRALFSDDELLLIFYNACSQHGQKMVPYLEKFALLNNLPIDQLIYPAHRELLPVGCFGDQK